MKKKRKSRIDKLGIPDNPVGIIILCVIIIFMSCVFIFQYRDYVPITRNDAQEYTGKFDHYDISVMRRHTKYLNIHMEDGTVLTLHHTCMSTEVKDGIDRLEPGDEITVLVNPASEYIIEIMSEYTEILNIDDSQKQMQNEALGFVVIGVVMICIALFFISASVYKIVRDMRMKGK